MMFNRWTWFGGIRGGKTRTMKALRDIKKGKLVVYDKDVTDMSIDRYKMATGDVRSHTNTRPFQVNTLNTQTPCMGGGLLTYQHADPQFIHKHIVECQLCHLNVETEMTTAGRKTVPH